MGAVDFIFWILAGAAPLSAGTGLAVIALTPAEFRAARCLFIAAGVLALLAVILWGSTTEVAFAVRATIVAIFAALFSLLTVESVRWVLRREDGTREEAHGATAYFSCGLAWWPEADNDKQAFNISIMNFGAAEPTIGMGPGPTVPHNHSQPFSSTAPLKCEITFYGDRPLFNVEVPIKIELYEVIRAENRNSNGRLSRVLDGMPIRINQINFPDNNKVKFYTYSFDVDAYIGIVNPDKFAYSTQDSDSRLTGKFITPPGPGMLTGPSPILPK